MPLSQLPWEVLEVISSFCGQADVISLAIACPAISEAVLPGIYRCIIIDAAPLPLHSERPVRSVHGQTIPCTFVRTIAGIKQCLEALAARPKFAAEVRSFVCNGNIGISDNVFLPLVNTALGNLANLRELSWTACPELPPSFLSQLASPVSKQANLQVLSVDLAIRPKEMYPEIEFRCLRTLRVRPFLNAEVLAWISSLVQTSSELEDIELGRFLDSKSDVGSSYRFVGLSDVHNRFEPVSAISGFFGNIGRNSRHKWQLKRLALSQTDTKSSDPANLSRTSNLSQLEELVLTGSGNEDEASHRLLTHITDVSPQLTKLTLNWCTSYVSMEGLFAKCCSNLKSLTVHVRDFPRRTLEIIAQKCTHTLCHLSLYMDVTFTLDDLEPLKEMRHLKALKIPFNHNVSSWELAASLPHLKVLELCLCNAPAAPRTALSSSRAPNMGLLTSGILDAWNDSLPSPLQYGNIFAAMRRHSELCYVVIDGHTTCLRHEAAPLRDLLVV